jgi:hypothetical protein
MKEPFENFICGDCENLDLRERAGDKCLTLDQIVPYHKTACSKFKPIISCDNEFRIYVLEKMVNELYNIINNKAVL